jgi:hypothetical protein
MFRLDTGRDGDGVVVLPPLFYRESPNQSARTGKVRTVVVHDTEGSYAGSVAWLCNSKAAASAHLVLREDGLEATQLVPWDRRAWHCAAYNDQTIGLEMAGLAKAGFADGQLRRAARIVAYFLHLYGLPATHVKPDAAGRLGRGWTLHQDLGQLGGGHHDPGFSRWRSLWFGALVRHELARGGFRKNWGVAESDV